MEGSLKVSKRPWSPKGLGPSRQATWQLATLQEKGRGSALQHDSKSGLSRGGQDHTGSRSNVSEK